MTRPGWYPDPEGGPGLRYFDGDDWGEQTRTRRQAEAAAQASVPSRWGGNPWFWLVAALVGALLLPLVAFFAMPHPAPPPEASDEVSPAASASADPSDLSLTKPFEKRCVSVPWLRSSNPPQENGFVTGAGLRVPQPALLTRKTTVGFSILGDSQGAWRGFKGDEKARLQHALTVGGVAREHPDFDQLEKATGFVLDCELYYRRNKLSYTPLVSEQVTVAGRPAWRRRVHVGTLNTRGSDGFTMEVLAVDTGDPKVTSVVGWTAHDGEPAVLQAFDGLWRQVALRKG